MKVYLVFYKNKGAKFFFKSISFYNYVFFTFVCLFLGQTKMVLYITDKDDNHHFKNEKNNGKFYISEYDYTLTIEEMRSYFEPGQFRKFLVERIWNSLGNVKNLVIDEPLTDDDIYAIVCNIYNVHINVGKGYEYDNEWKDSDHDPEYLIVKYQMKFNQNLLKPKTEKEFWHAYTLRLMFEEFEFLFIEDNNDNHCYLADLNVQLAKAHRPPLDILCISYKTLDKKTYWIAGVSNIIVQAKTKTKAKNAVAKRYLNEKAVTTLFPKPWKQKYWTFNREKCALKNTYVLHVYNSHQYPYVFEQATVKKGTETHTFHSLKTWKKFLSDHMNGKFIGWSVKLPETCYPKYYECVQKHMATDIFNHNPSLDHLILYYFGRRLKESDLAMRMDATAELWRIHTNDNHFPDWD